MKEVSGGKAADVVKEATAANAANEKVANAANAANATRAASIEETRDPRRTVGRLHRPQDHPVN